MKDTGMFIVFLLGLAVTLYAAYLPWFRPEKWKEQITKERQMIQDKAPFLPQNLGIKYFNRHPNLDLLWARLAPLLIALLCIFGIIVAIIGRF